MSLKIGIGLSHQLQDSRQSGRETAMQAADNLRGAKPDIMILLASSMYDQPELIKGVAEVAENVPIVGCTTAGAITNKGLHENSVILLALGGERAKFYPVKAENISKSMREAGREFGQKISEATNKSAKLAFIFSDALSGNGTELTRGVLEILGANFALTGGAAGDDMSFKKTFQYYGNEVLTDAAVGFAVTGDIKYGVGAGHGWEPIGNPRIATKTAGTTIFELDGKPAFSMYQDFFQNRASDFKQALSLAAVSYPLGMKVKGSDKYMIRVPLAVNEDGSIVCGAEVLEGSEINLMIGTIASALWAARDTSEKVNSKLGDVNPRIVFVSDCVARKILYGERVNSEVSLISEIMGNEAQIFGFFSYGQISPFHERPADVNTCDPGFYEQSISIAAFGE